MRSLDREAIVGRQSHHFPSFALQSVSVCKPAAPALHFITGERNEVWTKGAIGPKLDSGKKGRAKMTTAVLLVEDDLRMRDVLTRYLEREDFVVHAAGDTAQADRTLGSQHIDLIILDRMLPGEDGFDYLRRLQGQAQRPPVLMLTARAETIDRIVGLELGADDYLAKPFEPRELLARIRAILRRPTHEHVPAAPDLEAQPIDLGRVRFDRRQRLLIDADGEHSLTSADFALLQVLCTPIGTPHSRDELMQRTRGRSMGPFDRAIDVQIARLRKMLEEDPAHPRILQTIRGYGYVLVPPGSEIAPGEQTETHP